MWLPGSILAAFLAPASLVIATVLAFLATELVTAAAWKALRPYGKWAAAGAILAAGVVIDVATYAFIAGLPIASVTLGKLVAKLWITAAVAVTGLTARRLLNRSAGSRLGCLPCGEQPRGRRPNFPVWSLLVSAEGPQRLDHDCIQR